MELKDGDKIIIQELKRSADGKLKYINMNTEFIFMSESIIKNRYETKDINTSIENIIKIIKI